MLTVQIGYSVYDCVVGFQWRVDFLDADKKRAAFFLDLKCLHYQSMDLIDERSLIATQDLEQVAELTRRLEQAFQERLCSVLSLYPEALELPKEVVY